MPNASLVASRSAFRKMSLPTNRFFRSSHLGAIDPWDHGSIKKLADHTATTKKKNLAQNDNAMTLKSWDMYMNIYIYIHISNICIYIVYMICIHIYISYTLSIYTYIYMYIYIILYIYSLASCPTKKNNIQSQLPTCSSQAALVGESPVCQHMQGRQARRYTPRKTIRTNSSPF